MSMARLVITAVTVEGRSKSEVARDYGISRVWVQKLVKRFETEGEAAYWPRSRRPHGNPRSIGLEIEDQIIRLRKTLTKQGLDAGAETIAAHLTSVVVDPVPATSTIWRTCPARFPHPAAAKRPRSSWKTFCADQPTNAGRPTSPTGISPSTARSRSEYPGRSLSVNIAAKARRITLGPQVVDTFLAAFQRWGMPARS